MKASFGWRARRRFGFPTVLLGLLCAVGWQRAASAATLPPGFAETRVATGLTNPTLMAIAPDGRVFVSEQAGKLRVIKNDTLLATPFFSLTVDTANERGLMGVALHPNFPGEPYVYAYYTSKTPVPHNRISRFRANGDVAVPGSEEILFELPPLGPAPIHNSGSLHFGIDGKLYVSVGENSFGPHSQNLNITLGKLLRINPDGSIPEDNPFYSTLSGNNRAIYAYGLRNPFTFAIQPGTGRIFVNDVGDKLYDEINDIVAAGNYGWPETEGPTDDPRFITPFLPIAWSPRSCTVIGAAFYNPPVRDFPSPYVGKYFFADHCGNYINTLDPATKEVQTFATGLNKNPLDIDVAADGKMYYLLRSGQVFKVFHSHGGPVISIQPESQIISVGEPVTFTVAANGAEPLRYQWERNGVTIPGANAASYSFGVSSGDDGAQFRCIVTDDFGLSVASSAATLSVTTNRTPNALITTPIEGATYQAGQTLVFEGDAWDTEDGPLPASAFSWEVVFDHDSHNHPALAPMTGVKSGSYLIPTIGEQSANVAYRIILKVTDSIGLVRRVDRLVRPQTTTLTVATDPAGRTVKLDGVPKKAPLTMDGVVGMRRNLEAPTFQQEAEGSAVWYEFELWSDGGASAHDVVLQSTDNAFTASFEKIVNPRCIAFPTLSRFVNLPFPQQTGTYMIDFDGTATSFPINATFGVSDGPRGGFPGQTATVAFGSNGKISGPLGSVSYQANQTYHVRMLVDLDNKKFSAWVTPPGGTEVQIRRDTVFRNERLVDSSNNNWGVFANRVASGGTLRVCDVELNCSGMKNTPPVVAPPPDVTVATGAGATSCSAVVSDDVLGVATATDNCSRVNVTRSGVPDGNVFVLGATTLTHTATDAGGLTSSAAQKVTVVDNTQPTISGVSVDKPTLWPPNHKMVDVTVSYNLGDNCGGAVTAALSVTSNEPVNGTGDGDTAPDWEVVDAHHVRLRAERSGEGTGRVYTMTIMGTDSAGNVSTQTVNVTVPHDTGN